MIPYTPSFLVIAARALASVTPGEVLQLARRDGSLRWDGAASLAWVQRAGYWSHLREAAGRSWWPLLEVRTVDDVAAVAARCGALSPDPVAGALALVAWPAHEAGESRYAQCGVVVDAGRVRPPLLPGGRCHEVHLAWGILGGDGRTWGVEVRQRLDASRGDRFVHWWELPDARARLGAAA